MSRYIPNSITVCGNEIIAVCVQVHSQQRQLLGQDVSQPDAGHHHVQAGQVSAASLCLHSQC